MSKLRLYGAISGYTELTAPPEADNSEVNVGNLAGNTYVSEKFSSNTYASETFASNTYASETFASNTYVSETFSTNTYVQDALGNAGVPSGTRQIFVQTAAPTGWTKDTTHNDKALRVVSGTASNGGIDSFSTTFGAGKTTDSHTLSTPQIPAHTHAIQGPGPSSNSQNAYNFNVNPGRKPQTKGYTVSAGGGAAHSHNLSLDIAYVDTIIATKD